METIIIKWLGLGGELESVVVTESDEQAVADALVKMIRGNVVTAGDSFTIEFSE